MSTPSIPSVDLSRYTSGNPAKQQQFIQDLGTAYKTVGFVAVKNHGINEHLIADFYQQVEQFFALPKDIKESYELTELNGQRAYTRFGKEHAKGSDKPDLKEFWQFGNPDIQNPKNVPVHELPRFNQTGEELFEQFYQAGKYLLQAIASFLELEKNYFDEHIHNGNSILRAIHYPKITTEPNSAVRAEAHEDINLITLLVGASADGLELLDNDNNWQKVSAPKGYIIVNVGDMLQRLTNNFLKSTTHRVVNPPKELWNTSRYSIPFFLHPKSEMKLNCLESCINKERTKQYDDITAGQYLQQRLIEIGLA